MAGQPKAPFYFVLFLVIAGLVAFAAYRSDILFPKAGNGMGDIDLPDVEAPDDETITTVKEYTFVPQDRLPEVRGTSDYRLNDNTVRFALNVWAGWGPIILANEGFRPGKVWKAADGSEFKVDLVLIDNPTAMRDAYASGEVQIGWATLDMLPLFMEAGFVDRDGNPRDSRVMPRVYQQIDWSNGGDGIVVRDEIKTVADLRGRKIVLAQNSPSHYFALNMLVAGGVQPSEVEFVFTEDAFQAAAAFANRKELAAVVSWAPDIYNLAETRGNRMLVDTGTANKLIADVWFARADFAKDHPEIIEALVRGIFDAIQDLKDPVNKQRAAELMAEGYSIPADETLAMFADAHNTNWGENYQFFMNQNNPANFERVWSRAYYLYRRIGAITHRAVPFDQVMDFSVIEKLGKEERYSSQEDEYRVSLVAKTIGEIRAEQDEILTNTVVIHFYPNSWDLRKTITKDVDGKTIEALYDPNVDNVLKEIASLAAQFGAAYINIEGHTDASMRGQVPEQLVKELSQQRADAVRSALLEAYPLEARQFTATGMGWDSPADASDPNNHAKNRRVEIKIYSAEKD